VTSNGIHTYQLKPLQGPERRVIVNRATDEMFQCPTIVPCEIETTEWTHNIDLLTSRIDLTPAETSGANGGNQPECWIVYVRENVVLGRTLMPASATKNKGGTARVVPPSLLNTRGAPVSLFGSLFLRSVGCSSACGSSLI